MRLITNLYHAINSSIFIKKGRFLLRNGLFGILRNQFALLHKSLWECMATGYLCSINMRKPLFQSIFVARQMAISCVYVFHIDLLITIGVFINIELELKEAIMHTGVFPALLIFRF